MQNFIEKPTSKLIKGMSKAKESWIEEQYQGIEGNLQNNNSKKAYQFVKELTNKGELLPPRTKQK